MKRKEITEDNLEQLEQQIKGDRQDSQQLPSIHPDEQVKLPSIHPDN